MIYFEILNFSADPNYVRELEDNIIKKYALMKDEIIYFGTKQKHKDD